jgi:hypothetical protein
MPSSKNPLEVIDVPQDIIDLAAKNPGIICNLRINQQANLEKKTDEERRKIAIEKTLWDTWNFYEKMEKFLRSVTPGTKIIMVCQGFTGIIFTIVTNITNIYWADDHYPRIDFSGRSPVVKGAFGESNLWGGFILAAAKVSKEVEKQDCLQYYLLFELAEKGQIMNNF